MGAKTSIEWTADKDGNPGASWNPIRSRNRETGKVGWYCEHATPGCEHCYSETMNRRLGTGIDFKAQNRDRVELYLDEKILTEPLRWKQPRRIFLCSMTDLFGEFVKDQFLGQIAEVMANTPHHTYQILTKRPKRMKRFAERIAEGVGVLPNCWFGVSAEDQPRWDERWPVLAATPAAVRWVSYEPALGPLNIDALGWPDWLVCGGESGPGARPFHIEWARSIIRQCKAAGVPAFLKQLGAVPIIEDVPPFNGGFPDGTHFGNRTGRRELNGLQVLLRDRKGGAIEEWAPDLRVRQYPAPERA